MKAAEWGVGKLGQELGKRKTREVITSPVVHSLAMPPTITTSLHLTTCQISSAIQTSCLLATLHILQQSPKYSLYTPIHSVTLLYSPPCTTSHSEERREATFTAPVYSVLYPPSPHCTHCSQVAEDKVAGKHSTPLYSYRNHNIEQYPPVHPKPRAVCCSCSMLKNLALVFGTPEAKS